MTTQYWMVKSEPESYSFADFVRDGRTAWTGVRNYAARLNLNAMKRGDRVVFYESVTTKAVVGLAHSLGLTVTVEGIEAIDQYQRLRMLQCRYAQGYLFSRPLAAEAVTEALQCGRVWLPETLREPAMLSA